MVLSVPCAARAHLKMHQAYRLMHVHVYSLFHTSLSCTASQAKAGYIIGIQTLRELS